MLCAKLNINKYSTQLLQSVLKKQQHDLNNGIRHTFACGQSRSLLQLHLVKRISVTLSISVMIDGALIVLSCIEFLQPFITFVTYQKQNLKFFLLRFIRSIYQVTLSLMLFFHVT